MILLLLLENHSFHHVLLTFLFLLYFVHQSFCFRGQPLLSLLKDRRVALPVSTYDVLEKLQFPPTWSLSSPFSDIFCNIVVLELLFRVCWTFFGERSTALEQLSYPLVKIFETIHKRDFLSVVPKLSWLAFLSENARHVRHSTPSS